jgi:hypothetical protein
MNTKSRKLRWGVSAVSFSNSRMNSLLIKHFSYTAHQNVVSTEILLMVYSFHYYVV